MLLTLNDDCLYLICKHLDMEDHISLSQASEKLREIIACYYETHNKVTLDNKIWSKLPQQLQEFLATFKSNIAPYIKELSIKSRNIEDLSFLDQLPLSKIFALYLEIPHLEDSNKAEVENFLSSRSAQLKSLTWRGNRLFKTLAEHKFPNVTKLHVCDYSDHINVKVEMFPQLTILQLTGPSVNVPNLCELKKLTTLELNYVCLTQEDLRMIFGALALRKLQIYTTSKLTVDGISKCQTLEELVLYQSFMQAPLDELTKLKSLHRISVIGAFIPLFEHPNAVCKNVTLTRREALKLSDPKLAKKLKNLQHLKICLPADDILNKESFCKAVLEILRNSHSLRVFKIYGPEFYAIEILEKIAQVFRSIYRERNETLSILFVCDLRDGLREPHRLENLSFPSFVKLSFKHDENYNYGHPQLQCDWRATNG